MPNEELQASWRRTEKHLRTAISEQELPQHVRHSAVEFIDHNEFGVAFELIVEALVDRNAELVRPAREALRAAATEMGLESNSHWQELTK